MSKRFAIYFTPPVGSPLACFGASWLGWDSASGVSELHPSAPGLDVSCITRTPRKYGFHGTIKPPFHLAEGQDVHGLEAAFRALCATLAPVTLEGLSLSRLGAFLALTPVGETKALSALAARVVQDLDLFRAPPSEEELARRRQRRLSPEQEANLLQWGYPYVLDAFQFHLTLTGRVAPEVGDAVMMYLSPEVARLRLRSVEIDALTLLGSDAEGRFHQLHRVPLTG